MKSGEMSERFKEPVLKTGDGATHRGFESHSLRQIKKALEIYSRAFLLLYQLYSHVLRTILRENITADFNIFLRAVRFYGANWQRIGNEARDYLK